MVVPAELEVGLRAPGAPRLRRREAPDVRVPVPLLAREEVRVRRHLALPRLRVRFIGDREANALHAGGTVGVIGLVRRLKGVYSKHI